jgi:hypothetical protein
MKVDEKFVPIEHFNGQLRDNLYVEGALELMVDDVMVSCVDYWDLIDQLWAYLVQGMEKLKAGEKFETYWPDQPIRLAMTPLPNGTVLIERSGTSDPDVKVVADTAELIDALVGGASIFFDVFTPLNTAWDTADIARILRELKEWRSHPA